MNHANLPNQYWAEAINTAVFLSNLLPTPSRGNQLPYVLWTNTPAKLTRLRPFGCQAVIHNLKRQQDWKLAPPGQEGVLLDFENDNMAYQILRLSDLTVIVTRNVTFNEKVFPAVANGKTFPLWHITGELHENKAMDPMAEPTNSLTFGNTQTMDREHSNCLEEPTSEPDTESSSFPGSPLRSCHLESSDQQQSENNIWLQVIGPRHPTLINSDMDPTHILPYARRARAFVTTSNIVLRTYHLALQCKDKAKLINAIEKELLAMNDLNVKKDHLHHTIEHKARLCKQGFNQTPGIDFKKTYTPTGRLNSLRLLIAHSCVDGLDFHQIDVKSAFLNAPLTETIYLSVPQGLDIDCQKYCLRLNKAIYGLKQAPLAWYNRLKDWLQSVGFNACKLDPCVFYRKQPDALWIYVHVDGMAIFGKNIQPFKDQIKKEFSFKDIGPADLLLGVKIQKLEDCITLHQQHFVDSLLDLYGMQNCKTVSTTLVPNEYLSPATKDERKTFNEMNINFRSAVGSINYLSTATRPDLSHAVSSLSQYLENPGIRHWKAFLHVLKYLRWGNFQLTGRPTSGYLAHLHGCLVFWKTRKQPLVLISTAEAEYKLLCDFTSELVWFQQWCQEADLFDFDSAITVWEDNQSCIKTANGNCNLNTKRMKHVYIQLHFVKAAIKNRFFELRYAPTSNMLADFLTKAVPKSTLQRALNALKVLWLG
ncbi:hypothetical protein O181_105174 [Austropuccinia psidii MF-1]|uniref:Reverse transcriptase Ty1/copia-type domain-containing protein n=1 Tax=Austropuccinia psidii MF-1 TaxID=1389203 RepID=A0A9Q3PKV3_9BASI|nr:hypothetical protein [Austropuccinia psidii MF-1]